MKRYITLLTIFILFSCDKKVNKVDSDLGENVEVIIDDSLRTANPEQIKFRDYLDRLPQLNLPFKFSCDSGLVWPKIDYENNVIKKYKPDGAGILGKIYQRDNLVGILYTYPADKIFPVIQIFDDEGNELQTIDLFELRNCVSDMNYYAVTRGFITKDLRLISWTEVIRCDDNGEKCDTTKTDLERAIY